MYRRPRVAPHGGLGSVSEELIAPAMAIIPQTRARRALSMNGACPAEWCTSRDSQFGWTRAQLTTADSRAG